MNTKTYKSKKLIRSFILMLFVCIGLTTYNTTPVKAVSPHWLKQTQRVDNTVDDGWTTRSSAAKNDEDSQGEPGFFESMIAEVIASIGKSVDNLQGSLGMDMDQIVYGIPGANKRYFTTNGGTDGQFINMYRLELKAGNPYGIVAMILYVFFRNIALGLMIAGLAAVFFHTAVERTPKAYSMLKDELKNFVFMLLLIFAMPYIFDFVLDCFNVLTKTCFEMVTVSIYGDTNAHGNWLGCVDRFKELVFGRPDASNPGAYESGFEPQPRIVYALLYCGSVFLGFKYAWRYIKIALRETVLLAAYPIVCFISVFDKKSFKEWNRRFWPRVATPMIDGILLLIPIAFAAATNTNISMKGNSAVSNILLSIIQLMMLWNIDSARQLLLELFGMPGTARMSGGGVGLGAMLGSLAGRLIGNAVMPHGKGGNGNGANDPNGGNGSGSGDNNPNGGNGSSTIQPAGTGGGPKDLSEANEGAAPKENGKGLTDADLKEQDDQIKGINGDSDSDVQNEDNNDTELTERIGNPEAGDNNEVNAENADTSALNEELNADTATAEGMPLQEDHDDGTGEEATMTANGTLSDNSEHKPVEPLDGAETVPTSEELADQFYDNDRAANLQSIQDIDNQIAENDKAIQDIKESDTWKGLTAEQQELSQKYDEAKKNGGVASDGTSLQEIKEAQATNKQARDAFMQSSGMSAYAKQNAELRANKDLKLQAEQAYAQKDPVAQGRTFDNVNDYGSYTKAAASLAMAQNSQPSEQAQQIVANRAELDALKNSSAGDMSSTPADKQQQFERTRERTAWQKAGLAAGIAGGVALAGVGAVGAKTIASAGPDGPDEGNPQGNTKQAAIAGAVAGAGAAYLGYKAGGAIVHSKAGQMVGSAVANSAFGQTVQAGAKITKSAGQVVAEAGKATGRAVADSNIAQPVKAAAHLEQKLAGAIEKGGTAASSFIESKAASVGQGTYDALTRDMKKPNAEKITPDVTGTAGVTPAEKAAENLAKAFDDQSRKFKGK